MKRFVLPLILLTAPALAQELPPVDPRILALPVKETGLLHLQTAPDVTQTILFQQGERITSVILSDPSLFFVNVAGTGDSLALRAAGPSALGVMSVRTTSRNYEFELMTGPSGTAAPVVRLTRVQAYQPPTGQPSVQAGTDGHFSYRLSGSKALRPTSIIDDGRKTYIQWEGDRAVPATFALGPTGNEQMVDGYMRGGVFTIDRVYDTLIFRIDTQRAKAKRQVRDKDNG